MGTTMPGKRNPSHLRLLFALAVVVPGLVLGVIALRSVNRERAFLELRLQRTIDAELVTMVSLLSADLDRIRDELGAGLAGEDFSSPGQALARWQARSRLVGLPFLLSPDLRILRPDPAGALSGEERAFLDWNREFITGQAPIPVYQNIAVAFQDEITRSKERASGPPPAGRPRPEPSDALGARQSLNEAQSPVAEVEARQKALSDFERSPDLRKSVYDQARERGQKTESRTVRPAAPAPGKKDSAGPSILISEPQRFGEITAGRESGLIPRFRQDRLVLLFWKRAAEGGFVGCVIDGESLRARLAALLPNIATPLRLLTILDENGRPLITPDETPNRDWRRPLVSREISEFLPRWEVAAYLASPEALASRAGLTAVILWILVLLLLVAMGSGGTYVLNTLRSEMLLARQKTTFVANVSHELKTPLTSIRMFAEILKDRRQPDPAKQQKYLDLMVSETDRLTRLINGLLDFARMEKGERKYKMTRLDPARLCERLVERERLRLEQGGFSVGFRNDLGEAVIEADGEALEQALLNLLSNAEKYSREAKRIEVEIGGEPGAVLIRVLDRGIGVPAREAKKIFQEFYRVDDSPTSRVAGSGLGLPIALRIVRDHGGDIRCSPRPGGGSVFEIRLPRREEGAGT